LQIICDRKTRFPQMLLSVELAAREHGWVFPPFCAFRRIQQLDGRGLLPVVKVNMH